MTECREIERLLTAYVDGEAAPSERASVDAHLERCPPCRRRVAGEDAARAVLVARREVLRPCASEQLRTRCSAHRPHVSAPETSRPSVFFRRSWVPFSLAATLLLAVAGVFLFGLNDRVEALAAQLALDHLKCFQVGTDHGSVLDASIAGRDWGLWQGWRLEVPASAAGVQLELRAVRRCLTSNGRVAHLMYTWRGEPLSVFVLPQTIAGVTEAQRLVEKFGQEAIVWSERGRTYIVLSKAPPGELAPVLDYVKAHVR
jgi:anti-sigma factor RsiW